MSSNICIEVCYLAPDRNFRCELVMTEGASLHDAIIQSGVLQAAPEIDLTTFRVGIYGKLKPPGTLLRENDRVEIYRSLIADPMEARRQRADRRAHEKPTRR